MKHTNNNIIQLPQRDPALAWVARRCRVTSPNTARTLAELAGFKGVIDNWVSLGHSANGILQKMENRQ